MYFGATSHAATGLVGDDTSIIDLIKPVYERFANHQYGADGRVGRDPRGRGAQALLRDKIPFLHTNAGGSLLALFVRARRHSVPGLAAPGAHLTLDLFKSALMFLRSRCWWVRDDQEPTHRGRSSVRSLRRRRPGCSRLQRGVLESSTTRPAVTARRDCRRPRRPAQQRFDAAPDLARGVIGKPKDLP